MPARTHLVECPLCRGTLEVEAQTGKVVGKWEKRDKNKPTEERFKDALEKEKETKNRLGEYFQSAQSQMDEKKKKAEEIFKKNLEKFKKGNADDNV